MSINILIGLLGGLALFLYGMQMMSNGLEAAAGNKMKQILEKLTVNRFVGVLVGAGITAIIQSSSATTVMVVGFVNSGMMTLKQAVWIIMGANIGTTITGQLIALNISEIAPLLAFLGVAAIVFIKKPKIYNYGLILAGLGVLFIGMDMMGNAMEPLQQSESFVSLMTRFSNPVLGILVGMIFTAIIQSSSASVGILQTLASGGLISFPSAVYVLFGQNIGTCITAVLASIGTGRNAKRATLIHLMFNLIGTIIFTIVCILLPLTSWVELLTPGKPAAQIANMHTLFNIVTTLLLLPFGLLLVHITEKILPEKGDEEIDQPHLVYINQKNMGRTSHVGTSAIALEETRKEIFRMLELVKENINYGFATLKGKSDARELMKETEDYIDFLNKEISSYISEIALLETNENDSQKISAYFKMCGDLERIGDHAMNLGEYAADLKKYHTNLSEDALMEVKEMEQVCQKSMELILKGFASFDETLFGQIAAAEQKIDDMTDQFKRKQIQRIRKGSCKGEASILYSEILTDFERIGDHVLNLGESLFQIYRMD